MSGVRLGRYVERHGKIVRKARALESSGTRCLEKETSSREGEGDCTMPGIVRETEVRGGREGKWRGGLLSDGRSQGVILFWEVLKRFVRFQLRLPGCFAWKQGAGAVWVLAWVSSCWCCFGYWQPGRRGLLVWETRYIYTCTYCPPTNG